MEHDTIVAFRYEYHTAFAPPEQVLLEKDKARRQLAEVLYPHFLDHKHVIVSVVETDELMRNNAYDWMAGERRFFEVRAHLSATQYERQRISVTPAARFEVMADHDIIKEAVHELGKRLSRRLRRGK